jgi:signal transduction histidine kinase/CheY-like chemotaxis protein
MSPPPAPSDLPAPARQSAIGIADATAPGAVIPAAQAERAWRVLEGVDQAFYERDLVSGEVWYSRQLCSLLGVHTSDPRGTLLDRCHPADRARFESLLETARRECGPLRCDLRYQPPDRPSGEWRWMRVIGRVLPGNDGRPARSVGMIQDVHDERSGAESLRLLAERMDHAMSALSEALVEGGQQPGDFFISPNLMRVLGYPDGTPVPDVPTYLSWVHPEDSEGLRREIRLAIEQPRRWNIVYRLRDAAGEWRWMRARGESRLDPERGLRAIGMVGDIHAFTLAQQELQRHREQLQTLVAERTARLDVALVAAEQARERAEQADRAKSAFLAHMSHEIRTPLNGLLGLTELALNSAESPAQQRWLEVALQSGRALHAVINDVLEISRLESGAPALVVDAFDAAAVLADAVRATAPLVGLRPVVTRYDFVGEPQRLRGDAKRLRQIAVNLLGNAAKFTEAGHIDLVAEVRRLDDGRAELHLTVADTGPGMTPEVAARVFEPFFQGDSGLARRHEGTGLGLAIARGLASAMDGELKLDTVPGQGSRFELRLPMAIDPGAVPLPSAGSGLAWVLVRNADDGAWMGRRIGRLGWQVETVLGFDALLARAAGDVAPDLLLLNPLLTPLDEPTLLRLRAALPATAITLMIRADWSDAALERLMREHGLRPFVSPMTPQVLAEMLAAARRGPREMPPAPHPAAPAPPPGAEVLLVEDHEVNRVIGRQMLENLGLRVRSAIDGEQSLQACLSQPPDVVLMDVRMPVMDGLEATRRLRALQAEGRLPRFPVLGLSAHALDVDRSAALQAGMDDYLTKPIDAERLRLALHRWVTGDAAGTH